MSARRGPECQPDESFVELEEYLHVVLDSFRDEWGRVTPNSADETHGVLDRALVTELLAAPGAGQFLDRLEKAQPESRPAVFLLRAAAGWNRDDVLLGVRQRTQLALRAYGLLPLPEGEAGRAECLERYLALTQYGRESRQFGPERRGNEEAAVLAALANLAQAAGLADANRLEWAMEARLAERAAQANVRKAGEYRLELAGCGLDAEVRATRAGAPVRSVPAGVRKHPAYVELRAMADQLRAQYARFRANLEAFLVQGEPLAFDELVLLRKLPAMRAMLVRLVFRDESGAYGLLRPDADELEGDQGPVPIGGPLVLAHPLQLAEANGLTAWQARIVRQRIVQPFKQVFRELYVPSANEREAGTVCNRFAGRALSSRAAAKSLQTRGWQVASGRVRARVFRVFPSAGLRAELEFPDAGPHFTDTDVLSTGGVRFVAGGEPPGEPSPDADVPPVLLAEVPPILFSEVLRDVELTVRAAHTGPGVAPAAGEVVLRRGEVVAALADAAGFVGVVLERDSVRVEGKGGVYRVSLSSGAVEGREMPKDWAWSHEELYLPFVGSEDRELAEIAGKVLYLTRP